MLCSGDQIGPYTLSSELGRGAFGVVWLAERRTAIATTKVALKFPLDDEVDLETVRQEANIWVNASGHPNVLPIIEANVYGNQVVIASEYAPDGSLGSWLKQYGNKAPSVESAREIISGILSGLEHLHGRKIIHRDLKPDNILFQGNTPRLADFGIARILKSTASQSGIIAGTLAYMAPEAFAGKRNEQTDIWSVGVIFYQLLTGRLPFPQTDFPSLIAAIQQAKPDPLPSSIPRPLQEIVERTLNKEVTKRYKTAAEVQEGLRRVLKAELFSVPPTMIEQLIRDGAEAFRGREYKLAVAKYEMVLKLSPDEPGIAEELKAAQERLARSLKRKEGWFVLVIGGIILSLILYFNPPLPFDRFVSKGPAVWAVFAAIIVLRGIFMIVIGRDPYLVEDEKGRNG